VIYCHRLILFFPSGDDDGWTHVLGHSRLKKRVLVKGAGERPLNGQVVTIRCCGRLESGKEVDRSDSLRFILGDGDVIQGMLR
jgi:FKBP-type peptidyl-prolyl cis-trans isomerase